MGSIGESEEVWDALEQVYMAAAEKGELPIRVFAMVPLPTWYVQNPSSALTIPWQAAFKCIPPKPRLTSPLLPQPLCVVIITQGWAEEDVGSMRSCGQCPF